MKTIPVSAVEISHNEKTGHVSATYAPQQTCPESCPLRGAGCYAESGPVGMYLTPRLNRMGDAYTVEDLAHIEARAITRLTGKRALRLHVVGDATTDKAAGILADASEYHTSKHGRPVWTYTHAWREVSRESWGQVSVLASCESTEDVRLAQGRGYATAIVVSKHTSTKTYVQDGLRLIPCPVQTGKAESCLSCGLCMRAGWLRESGASVAFEAHGSGQGKVKAQLVQIQQQA